MDFDTFLSNMFITAFCLIFVPIFLGVLIVAIIVAWPLFLGLAIVLVIAGVIAYFVTKKGIDLR
jgi:hypothetical protein